MAVSRMYGMSIRDIGELIADNSGKNERTLIVGSPVYDRRTKYECLILKGPQFAEFHPCGYGVHMIAAQQEAKEAEREVLIRSSRLGIPADLRSAIKHFQGHGYVVEVRIVPEDSGCARQVDLALMKLVNEIGVNPAAVKSPGAQ